MALIRPQQVYIVNSYYDFWQEFFGGNTPKEAGEDGTDQELIEEVLQQMKDAEYTCLFVDDRRDGYFVIQKYWSLPDDENHWVQVPVELCPKENILQGDLFITAEDYERLETSSTSCLPAANVWNDQDDNDLDPTEYVKVKPLSTN